MKRRQFITLFAVGLAATALPAPLVDDYGQFLERVRDKVVAIVLAEGRGLRRMWIEPPRADGARYTRSVHIELEAGPSLLDKLHFQFDEVSGSRLKWGGT